MAVAIPCIMQLFPHERSVNETIKAWQSTTGWLRRFFKAYSITSLIVVVLVIGVLMTNPIGWSMVSPLLLSVSPLLLSFSIGAGVTLVSVCIASMNHGDDDKKLLLALPNDGEIPSVFFESALEAEARYSHDRNGMSAWFAFSRDDV